MITYVCYLTIYVWYIVFTYFRCQLCVLTRKQENEVNVWVNERTEEGGDDWIYKRNYSPVDFNWISTDVILIKVVDTGKK
jgi:hypothetical protein